MDPYGDCLGSVLGKEDAHNSRPHNAILSNLTELGTELGVTCDNEIVNEFRQLLPADRRQKAIDKRIEGHRPDFRAHLPTKNGDGEWSSALTPRWYELKCIHSGNRYREGPAGTKAAEAPGSWLTLAKHCRGFCSHACALPTRIATPRSAPSRPCGT